jgi:two-component system, NarL family, sensor histidine kinase UhpB
MSAPPTITNSQPGRPAVDQPLEKARTGLRVPRSWERLSLLWRVFAANVAVFVVAFAVLAWAPVTVHRVATPSELVVLVIGLVLMLTIDLLLLRKSFAPLRRLAATMGAVSPAEPGRRAERFEGAGEEVLALAGALNSMLDRLEGERRESGRLVLAAQERERIRIARELHDEVGQTLTAIALQAERAATHPESQPGALADITQTALRSLEDVRRIGRELRPEALDDLGLVNALIALCSRIDRQQGLRVRRDLDWKLPQLSAEVELVIYRVAQEALTNVLRHAGATEVFVGFKREDGELVLVVRDNGRGLPPAVRESGLRAMRDRARVIDATLEVGPDPRRGTAIVLRVPV